MNAYSLEPGEYIYRLTCECCGAGKNRVWGFVYRGDEAHAVYYALLNIEEENPRVGLTLSVGAWWDGSEPSERSWMHIDIRAEADQLQLRIRDPKESNFYPWPGGGTPLTPEQASVGKTLEEFRSVSNFIVGSDAAITSYLNGSVVNTVGREPRDADPLHRC